MHLYFIGIKSAVLVFVYLAPYLECLSTSTSTSSTCLDKYSFNLQLVTIAAVVGECSVFLGLMLCTDMTLGTVIDRMGAERPKALKRNETTGGWDIDKNRSFDWFLLFGEIDIVAPVKSIYQCVGSVNACCCVAATLDDGSSCDTTRLE